MATKAREIANAVRREKSAFAPLRNPAYVAKAAAWDRRHHDEFGTRDDYTRTARRRGGR